MAAPTCSSSPSSHAGLNEASAYSRSVPRPLKSPLRRSNRLSPCAAHRSTSTRRFTAKDSLFSVPVARCNLSIRGAYKEIKTSCSAIIDWNIFLYVSLRAVRSSFNRPAAHPGSRSSCPARTRAAPDCWRGLHGRTSPFLLEACGPLHPAIRTYRLSRVPEIAIRILAFAQSLFR